jgi:putative hemolysin
MTIDARVAALVLALAAAPALAQPAQPTLANPASQNCIANGGQLTIEKSGSGGQFGVCTFPDNLQCEEWAMMRGDCRTGGIKVTGYATPAARYCAITGGTYAVVAASNTPNEKGKCTFPGGRTCDAKAYFDGKCSRQPMRTAAAKTIRAHFTCSGGKRVDAVFTNGAQSSVALTLSDGRSMTLPQAMSGSGARYASADESFVFWNKGNTAFIEENGKTTYDGCETKPR